MCRGAMVNKNSISSSGSRSPLLSKNVLACAAVPFLFFGSRTAVHLLVENYIFNSRFLVQTGTNVAMIIFLSAITFNFVGRMER
jgi:hypothetical protein